jgi:hypothetical protein
VLPGDYNTDGLVDVADGAVWRAAYGTSVSAFNGADGNGDGVVDQADYVVWRKNVGNTTAAGLRASITGPLPPPITDALWIMLIVQAWKDDSIEIRDAATQYAVEILQRERARIERQVENELGPLAWAVFDLEQPSQGELRQRELESDSPIYILLREAAANHADPEVRARAQGVLDTIHPREIGLPDGVFELPPDLPGPIVPPPVPVPPEDIARIIETGTQQAAVDESVVVPSDNYHTYLVEDGAERIILDFTIEQGQPIETPEVIESVDGIQPSDDVDLPAVSSTDYLAGYYAPDVASIQTEIVALQLVGDAKLVQDNATPANVGVTEEWQLVISDGKVKSITKNGKPHTDPLPANVANDVKPILDQVKSGMVGSILVRYYEVLGCDGKRLDFGGELKETITPSGGVKTGGTKVKDGVVSTPDRLFHIDNAKTFRDKTVLQVIEVSGTVVAYHKITITRTGVTLDVLTKQQYDEELKKLANK